MCFFFPFKNFLLSFFHFSFLSFGVMEAFISLVVGPPPGFRSSLVPLVACNPFGVLSSLGVGVGPFVMFHVLIVGSYFLSVVWLDIRNIVRLIRFSL